MKMTTVLYGSLPTVVIHATTDKRKIRSWKRRYSGCGIIGHVPTKFFTSHYRPIASKIWVFEMYYEFNDVLKKQKELQFNSGLTENELNKALKIMEGK